MTTFSCITPYSYQLLQQAGFTTNEIGEVLEPCASSYDYKPFLDSFSWPPGFIKTMEDSELLSGVGRVFAKSLLQFSDVEFQEQETEAQRVEKIQKFRASVSQMEPEKRREFTTKLLTLLYMRKGKPCSERDFKQLERLGMNLNTIVKPIIDKGTFSKLELRQNDIKYLIKREGKIPPDFSQDNYIASMKKYLPAEGVFLRAHDVNIEEALNQGIFVRTFKIIFKKSTAYCSIKSHSEKTNNSRNWHSFFKTYEGYCSDVKQILLLAWKSFNENGRNSSWLQVEDNRFICYLDHNRKLSLVEWLDPKENDKIKHILGAGVTGTVYRAKELAQNQYYALKVAKVIDESSLNKNLRYLAREVECLVHLNSIISHTSLQHQPIFMVQDLKKYFSCYATNEYAGNLVQFVTTPNSVTDDEIIAQFRKIIELVGLLYKNGYLHRDIAPRNICYVLKPRFELRLIDFSHRAKRSELNYSSEMALATEILSIAEALQWVLCKGDVEANQDLLPEHIKACLKKCLDKNWENRPKLREFHDALTPSQETIISNE